MKKLQKIQKHSKKTKSSNKSKIDFENIPFPEHVPMTPEDEAFIKTTFDPNWSRRFLNHWKPRLRRYLQDADEDVLNKYIKPLLRGDHLDWAELLLLKVLGEGPMQGFPEELFEELILSFAEAEDNNYFSKYTTKSIEDNPWAVYMFRCYKEDLLKYINYVPVQLRHFLMSL